MKNRLRVGFKLWLEQNRRYVFGEGLATALAALAREGSMATAAHKLGRSYRYFWGNIRAAERILGRQLVRSAVGGRGQERSALTPFAEVLLKKYFRMRAVFELVCTHQTTTLARELAGLKEA